MKPPATTATTATRRGKPARVAAPSPPPAEADDTTPIIADTPATATGVGENMTGHGETGLNTKNQTTAPPMFGAALEPVLREQCEGRLSAVSWFRTDWQRGGALTGFADYTEPSGAVAQVVVKLPVPPRELEWLARLSEQADAIETTSVSDRLADRGGVTPTVYAHGEALNGYDLAWVVMERIEHGPLGSAWGGREFDLLVEAAARFYAAAAATPLPETAQPEPKDWPDLLRRAREKTKSKDWPNGQAWKKALKLTGKHLDAWLDTWSQRPVTGWCHGDLHLGNAMSRHGPGRADDAGDSHGAVLLDLANIRPGCWVEDAVYAEHLYWSRRERMGGRKLVSQLAKARRAHGLEVGDDWSVLADVNRKLLALATPVTFAHHGAGTAHLDAALAMLN